MFQGLNKGLEAWDVIELSCSPNSNPRTGRAFWGGFCKGLGGVPFWGKSRLDTATHHHTQDATKWDFSLT